MKTVYIQEWRKYSKSKILQMLDNHHETFDKLLKYSIIDKEKDRYQVNYVGVIIINDFVINCYPKYIPEDIEPSNDFSQILKAIKKYKRLHEDFEYQNEELDDISYNQLSMMIFFIEDYYENGIYTNSQKILQINGSGEIDWDKTINNTIPIIKNDKPYYIDLYTKYNVNDFNDYFRLLHEYIITISSKRLEEAGLLKLFDLTPVELSDREFDDFGDFDFILNQLKKELNVEFNSHKQKLLKSMYTFIKEKNSFSNKNYLTLYGTSKYNVIWEEMCSKIFENKLNKTLYEMELKDYAQTKLINIIDKPEWDLDYLNQPKKTETLKPDLITFHKDIFIILDAKYYNLDFSDDNLTGQPGLESITKQYLYELAYRKFLRLNGFKKVKNAFLFPSYGEDIENRGSVKFKILSDLGLADIGIIMIPANKLHQMYLNNDNEFFDIQDLVRIL